MKMRLIIVMSACIIAHAVNPQIMTLYAREMEPGYYLFGSTAFIIAIILDSIDLIRGHKKGRI
jgi:hypothetical protein